MVVLHASPTSCLTAARFARMASVEELDSSLTLLTHHSAVFVKASPPPLPPLPPLQRNPGSEGAPSTSPSAVQLLSFGGAASPASGCSMMTPPGTPQSSHAAGRQLLSQQREPSATVSSSAVIFDYSAATQTPQVSPTTRVVGAIPPNTPTTPATTPMFSMIVTASSAAGNVPGGPNVVAIDNKIEQAMVAQLESQNQVLKQFAPAEVVANLALLVQNAQQQKQLQQQKQVQSAAVSATATAAQPAVAPPAQALHSAQVQQPQLPVGVVPAPVPVLTNVSGADLNTIVPTSISSVGDAPIATATASQLSSTLNSMAVNVSSSASSTTTL
ncbi:unnamed protein product [Toxocara canis]|uniref:Polyhomeotic-like protein 3 n=1 Tax=Toxocara canis TaxID=6265 RepID=A0A183VB81_TOXCA|nr:unnamed protein product [Toxocara canis]